MPTGYTADLYDGKDVSFREFVLRCARAMSPFIMQRDNDINEPPKKIEFDEYSYAARELPQDQAKLDAFLQMSRASRKELWRAYVKRVTVDNESSARQKAALRKRYEDMLAEVYAWDVDPILDKFKEFMIDQLKESIRFDCTVYHHEPMPFEEWEEHEIKMLRRWVEMHTEDIERDKERVRFQNEYTEKLYAALEAAAPATGVTETAASRR